MSSKKAEPLDLGDDADDSGTFIMDKKTGRVLQVPKANNQALEIMVEMGFNRVNAEAALTHAKNDINIAVEMLSKVGDKGNINDGEFGLLASAKPEPLIHPPTVFKPRVGGTNPNDHFQDNVTEGSVGEMVDSRISSLTSMGFTSEQAEVALNQAKGDINEALTILLQEQSAASSTSST